MPEQAQTEDEMSDDLMGRVLKRAREQRDNAMTDTMTMREKCWRAAWAVTNDQPWNEALAIEKHPYTLEVDAILAVLEEPDEGMLNALVDGLEVKSVEPDSIDRDEVLTCKPTSGWSAAIRHIRTEGRE